MNKQESDDCQKKKKLHVILFSVNHGEEKCNEDK